MQNNLNKLLSKIKNDKQIIIKLMQTAFTRAVSAFGTFVFNFVLARYLGATELGNFMIAYSLLIGLGFFARFGLSSAIMRFAAIMYSEKQFGKIRKLRQDVFFISLVVTIVFGVFLVLFRDYISTVFFNSDKVSDILLVFAFALPFYSYQTIQSSFFKAYAKPQIAPFFEVGLTTFITGTSIAILAWFGMNINGVNASIVFFFASVIVALMGYIMLNRIVKKAQSGNEYQKENYTGFFSSLPDYALSAFTGYLLKFSPTIILGLYASSKDVGLYSLANSTAFVVNFVLWIVSTVYAPHFANSYYKNEMNELRRLVRNSTLYMMIIALPIFIVIVSFPTFILGLFGEEFKEAKNALLIMAVAQLFNVATGPVYFLLNMTGHEKYLRNIVICTAIVSVLSSFLLSPYYGFMGAAISSALGLVLQNAIAFSVSKKYLGISFFNKE